MFPGVALIVPLLKLFTEIDWINTYQAMIVPSLSFALPLAVWTLATFFRQMPKELEEAAMVDGLTRGQAFRKVILPLAAPGMFTTAIITFIAAWNEFIIALTMVNEKDIQTANVVISQFTGAFRVRQSIWDKDGRRRDRHGATRDRGAGLPATHHRGPDRWRRQVVKQASLTRLRVGTRRDRAGGTGQRGGQIGQ